MTSHQLLQAPAIHHGNRAWWHARLQGLTMEDIPAAEVKTHLDLMPDRYWERIDESDLIWSLKTIHQFLSRSGAFGSTQVCAQMDWRHIPEKQLTKVLVCSWDRPGLLATIAAAFRMLHINIVRAEVFTRSDSLVMDIFEVCLQPFDSIVPASSLQQAAFLVEGALNNASLFSPGWPHQRDKILEQEAIRMTPRLRFDNRVSSEHTVLIVETADRMGLLQDILQALENCRLSIAQATIDTDEEVAVDIFHFTGSHGEKIEDYHRLQDIHRAVQRAILNRPMVPDGQWIPT